MFVHLWQNRGRFTILHLPSTSHAFPSLGKKQADSGASKIITLVLQKLTADLEVERYIWKKQGKPKYPVIAISQNLLSETDRKDGFEIISTMDFHRKAECWQDVGASNDTIWSLIICRFGLSGWHWALCELFHLLVAFGCFLLLFFSSSFFFFFLLSPGVAGKGWWWEDTAFTASLRHKPVYLLKQQTSSMPGEQWQRAVPEWDETVRLLKRPPTSPERL